MRARPEFHPELALILMLVAATLAWGCANLIDSESAKSALTASQRDSTLAESSLPGASTVGRALDRADDALARSASLDSLTRP